MKRTCKYLTLLLAVLMLLTFTAYAAGNGESNRDVALNITYTSAGAPLSGAEFRIYLVATKNKGSALVTTQDFEAFNVDIRGENDDAWNSLASTLEGYVLRDNITPTDAGVTDAAGVVSFPTGSTKLTPGLYLVTGLRHSQNGYRYDAVPFMVMLPTQDAASGTVYNVAVSPKSQAEKLPDVPVEPTKITRKVIKIWDDEGNSSGNRPESVTVQLLRDGVIYDTAVLNDGNSWSYTWADLSDDYTWALTEEKCPGYTVSIRREGITFVVTNTSVSEEPAPAKPDTPEEQKLPQTGQLWWPVPLLILIGAVFVAVGLIRRRRTGNER